MCNSCNITWWILHKIFLTPGRFIRLHLHRFLAVIVLTHVSGHLHWRIISRPNTLKLQLHRFHMLIEFYRMVIITWESYNG